jgi:hypothetical protein
MPARVAPADPRMKDTVARTRLVLTGSATWAFEATGMFSKIEISRNAVGDLYAFCFTRVGIYNAIFAGRENLTGDVEPETIPELQVPLKALKWVYAESTNSPVGSCPARFPATTRGRIRSRSLPAT